MPTIGIDLGGIGVDIDIPLLNVRNVLGRPASQVPSSTPRPAQQAGTLASRMAAQAARSIPAALSLVAAPAPLSSAQACMASVAGLAQVQAPAPALGQSAGRSAAAGIMLALDPGAMGINQAARVDIAGATQAAPAMAAPSAIPTSAPSTSVPAAILRAASTAQPMATTSTGQWYPATGNSLSAMIGARRPIAGDYIQTDVPSTCEVDLNPLNVAQAKQKLVMRYLAGSSRGGGLVVRLMDGATLVARWVHPVLPLEQKMFVRTLTQAQRARIQNYAALRMEFESI